MVLQNKYISLYIKLCDLCCRTSYMYVLHKLQSINDYSFIQGWRKISASLRPSTTLEIDGRRQMYSIYITLRTYSCASNKQCYSTCWSWQERDFTFCLCAKNTQVWLIYKCLPVGGIHIYIFPSYSLPSVI